MSINHTDLGDLRTIMLSGRMDVRAWDAVADQLVDLTQAHSKIVLDLSALPMLASIGIRAIVTSARDVTARGGKMGLVVDPASTVMTTLKFSGIEQIVPIFRRARDAEIAVSA